MRKLKPEEVWLQVKVGGEDECWPWQGGKTEGGYGTFGQTTAHRYIFVMLHGPLAKGLKVCHSCDNPGCCNPKHLWAGTQKQNLADMDAKGRRGDSAKHGEAHGRAKLTWKIVDKIRSRYAKGKATQMELAAEYGVGQNAISHLLNCKTWRPEHRPPK